MKEKEYKEEIIRLENVLLEKEKTIQDLQDKIHLLNSQKCNKKYNLINIQKDYFKNSNNEAIYNALIRLLSNYIYDEKMLDWKTRENYLINETKKIKEAIKQLQEERDLNND